MNQPQRQQPPRYGIIFNWDGTPLGYLEPPYSADDLLDIIYAPLKDTQVGAMSWCVGTHEAAWPSDALSMVGDSEGRLYSSVKGMRRAEGIRDLFDRGEDFYGKMVARGHELGIDVYASIRMNDNHFWSDSARRAQPLKPEEMAGVTRPGLTQLRKDHPEWTLGADDAPRWAATSWNFAVPEVREHMLQYISEACAQADWDGVELDWQRHAFHLPEHDAYRLRYTLTDLMRAVRRMTDGIAEERGAPFHVATRVGASMETCRRIGYDVETWTYERLCDIVATNANSGTDPGVEIETYLELMRDTGVTLYPGFDSHGEGGQGRLVPTRTWMDAWYSGLAQGYYRRGAAGIHIFNWKATADTHRSLFTTIGSLDTLERTDKVYTAVKRIMRPRSEIRYGAERDDRLLGEVPVDLYGTLTGEGPLFHVDVHDDLVAEDEAGRLESVELQIEINHMSPADVVEITLDGTSLGEPEVKNTAALDANIPTDVAESSWLVWQLTPQQVALGVREVRVRLVERDARIRPPLVVENVEVHVRY